MWKNMPCTILKWHFMNKCMNGQNNGWDYVYTQQNDAYIMQLWAADRPSNSNWQQLL
jgi:hypothetical protein